MACVVKNSSQPLENERNLVQKQPSGETLQSVETAHSGMRPWDDRGPSLSKEPSFGLAAQANSIPQHLKNAQQELIKQRLMNRTQMHQYKQQNTLVSNMQLARIIKKDMQMFTGPAGRDQPKSQIRKPCVPKLI